MINLIYKDYFHQLIKTKHAYPCFYSQERLNNLASGKLTTEEATLEDAIFKDFDLDKWFRPRHFFPKTYKCNCIIDIYKTKNILKGYLFGNKVIPLITDDFKIDIDDKKDFKIAENYLKLKI